MFQHVIVPFDGRTLDGRTALAPAADLAWRCGGKVVLVTTTKIDDDALRVALKSQAMAKSGADADFWVDLDTDIGSALIEAAAHRADPVICVASRTRTAGVVRKKTSTSPLPEAVLLRAPVPVLVVGPAAELSRGLPLSSLYVPIDGNPESVQAAGLAVNMARALRLDVTLLHIVSPGGSEQAPQPVAALYDAVRAKVPHASLDLIETADPAAAVVAIAGEDDDGMILLPRNAHHDATGLDAFAEEVIRTSSRAVVLPPLLG